MKGKHHGKASTGAYKTWNKMKDRCYNKNHKHYSYYGGRGIFVCEEWRHDFLRFLSDMGDRPDGMTLDRIDSDKGYSKENCRWATKKEQQNNMRNNHAIEIDGVVKNVSQWAQFFGVVSPQLASVRMKRGMPAKEAFTKKNGRPEYGKKKAKTADALLILEYGRRQNF